MGMAGIYNLSRELSFYASFEMKSLKGNLMVACFRIKKYQVYFHQQDKPE